jgi:hypothetical protein
LCWTLLDGLMFYILHGFGLLFVMNYVDVRYFYLLMFILWLWGYGNQAKIHVIYIVYLVCLDFHL